MSWRTNEEMATLAHEMAELLLQALANEGTWIPGYVPHPDGAPTPNVGQTLIDSIVADAVDFMSLDPQKITEEYLRMQRAAYDTGGEDGDAKAYLKIALGRLAGVWHGSAAEAFARQMSNIEEFMNQQERHLLRAAQGVGTAFGLSARIRESYCNLAENISEACRGVIAGQLEAEPSVSIASGIEVVKSLTDLLGMEKITELKDWAIDKFFELASGAAEAEPVDTGAAQQVLDSYLRARDQLRRSFDDGLNQLRDWLDNQDTAYMDEGVPLWEPLPSSCDVDSPDFSYEHFFNNYHDKGTYTPTVEQERREYVEEKQRGAGVIGQRLDGQE